MPNAWNSDRFRELLARTVNCTARDLSKILEISPDYTANVPKLQFPMPKPHGGQARAIALEFDQPLDSNSVSEHTVFIKRTSEKEPLPAEINLVSGRTIVIQPQHQVSSISEDNFVDIIVSPGVRMSDGRSFSGICFRFGLA